MVRPGRNSNSSEILCMSTSPASIKRIWSKATEKRWRHHFPHYKSMGAFCCHGHQSFDPICLKTLCSFSPLPVMLHIKFDQDWPTCLRDIGLNFYFICTIQTQLQSNTVIIEYKHYTNGIQKKVGRLIWICIPNMCNNTVYANVRNCHNIYETCLKSSCSKLLL